MLKSWIKELRVTHYCKNLLIFMPVVFGGELLNWNFLFKTIVGFICFCMVSSAVYLINDIKDVDKDRLHEKKKNRPIAAGIISITAAKIGICFLIIGAIFFEVFFVKNSSLGLIVMLLYFGVNIGYSVAGLKKIPVLDVFCLAAGFLLRMCMGGAITGIKISSWLYLVVLAGALYLGFGKRRNELASNGSETRIVLQYYSYEFLDKNMYACMTMAVVFFSLWCQQKGQLYLVLVPLLLAILFRYSLDIEQKNSDGDPINVILHDKVLVGTCMIFAMLMIGLLYFL